MREKICPVVMGKTLEEFLENLKVAELASDIVELRVDMIERMTPRMVEEIKKNVTGKAIFTCRTKREGGSWQGSENERIACLEAGFREGFTYVDVELSTLEEGACTLSRTKARRSIVSYHDFKRTPSYKELEQILTRMRRHHPGIMKIATMVKWPRDRTHLYRLLLEHGARDHLIVLGMGEMGRETRVVSLLLGGELTYAPIGDETSAPGQLAYSTLVEIYTKIENGR